MLEGRGVLRILAADEEQRYRYVVAPRESAAFTIGGRSICVSAVVPSVRTGPPQEGQASVGLRCTWMPHIVVAGLALALKARDPAAPLTVARHPPAPQQAAAGCRQAIRSPACAPCRSPCHPASQQTTAKGRGAHAPPFPWLTRDPSGTDQQIGVRPPLTAAIQPAWGYICCHWRPLLATYRDDHVEVRCEGQRPV